MRAKIRRTENGSGWFTWDTQGEWSGYFEAWKEALEWVTDSTSRLEYYANHQRR